MKRIFVIVLVVMMTLLAVACGGGSTDGGKTPSKPKQLEFMSFDNFVFKLNGKTYVLGEVTIGQLMDDGWELAYLVDQELVMDPAEYDWPSPPFFLKTKYQSIGLRVQNKSGDETIPHKDVPVTQLFWGVYLEDPHDFIEVPFDISLSIDDLLEKAGKPTRYEADNEDNFSEGRFTAWYEDPASNYFKHYAIEYHNGTLVGIEMVESQ